MLVCTMYYEVWEPSLNQRHRAMLPPHHATTNSEWAASAAEDGNGVWVALFRGEDVEDEVIQQGLQKTGSFRGS